MMNSMVSAAGAADSQTQENMLRSLNLNNYGDSNIPNDTSTSFTSPESINLAEDSKRINGVSEAHDVSDKEPLTGPFRHQGGDGGSLPLPPQLSVEETQAEPGHSPTTSFGGMAELEQATFLNNHNPEPTLLHNNVSSNESSNRAQHHNSLDENLLQSSAIASKSGIVVDTTASTEQITQNSAAPGNFKYDGKKSWFHYLSGSPASRPTGTEWMPDSVVLQCHDCKAQFDFFNRKHHCRHCGRIFCGKCSSQFLLLPVRFGVREPQRCCEPCATTLEPLQEELVKTMSNQTRELAFDPKSRSSLISNPVSFSMTAEITKAARAVENFFDHCPNATIQDQFIPSRFLKQAKGLAFLTVIKAGFLFSGRFGTGLVVGKGSDGAWSAPSAIATMGLGWGAQIGGEVSDFVIILNTEKALEAFSGSGQISLGAELGMSVGPLGRSGEASLNLGDGGVAPCYTYSQSKGLFAGISLEGAIISARSDVNKRFYGRDYSPCELLSGQVPPPVAAKPLYSSLEKALARPSDPLPAVVENFVNR